MKKAILFSVILFFMSSCSTLKVAIVDPHPYDMAQVQNIVLVPVVFSERQLATLPLIDAAVYNSGIRSTAEEQAEIMKNASVEASQFYQEAIKSKTGKNVIIAKRTLSETRYDIKDDSETINSVKSIATEYKADLVVIVVSRVRTVGVGLFGIRGGNVLDATMQLYDINGESSGKAVFTSETISCGSKDLDSFKEICDLHLALGDELVALLF